MHLVLGFMASVWKISWPWRIWVKLLMAANGLMPFLFLDSVESKVVLLVFIVAAMTQVFIYHAKGFVRLLGVGHVF